MKKITLQVHVTPYAGTQVVEALEAAMVGAVFDFDVSILFRGNGVFCLLADQNAQALGRRTVSNIMAALDAYEIKRLYVCENSLRQHGVTTTQLIDQVQPLNRHEIGQLLNEQDAVVGI